MDSLILKELVVDSPMLADHLVKFIRDFLKKTGHQNLVLGLSGGIDSAVVAYLAVQAIEPENVTGVIMPYASSNPENIADAEEVISQLNLKRRFVEITPMVDAYFDCFPTDDNNRRGNKMARERMSVLYDISAELKALVIGTSNKSEILMGYGTMFGDLACALNPLGNLYKTQVRQLAAYLNVPAKIIDKAPSADLWHGQTDEDELGVSYNDLDKILVSLIDLDKSKSEIAKMGYEIELIDRLLNIIERNRFKGCLPAMAELPNKA